GDERYAYRQNLLPAKRRGRRGVVPGVDGAVQIGILAVLRFQHDDVVGNSRRAGRQPVCSHLKLILHRARIVVGAAYVILIQNWFWSDVVDLTVGGESVATLKQGTRRIEFGSTR